MAFYFMAYKWGGGVLVILTTCKLGDDPPSVAFFSVQLPEARGCHRKNAKTHGAFLSKNLAWGMAGMARFRDICGTSSGPPKPVMHRVKELLYM